MLKNERILITGGTGSLGYALASLLCAENELVIYSRNEERQYLMGQDFKAHKARMRYAIGDVRDAESLDYAMRGCSVVIHAAAMKDLIMCEDQVTQSYLNNVIGTQNVLQVARRSQSVKRLCAVSTDKAAAPTSVYGCTKYIMERLATEAANHSDITMSSVRFGNMINSRGSLITIWRDNPPMDIKLTHPDISRFFFTVEDGARTVVECIEKASNGEIYIRNMKAARIKDILTLITGRTEFEIMGLFPGEKVHEDLTSAQELAYCHVEGDYYVIRKTMNPNPPAHLSSATAIRLTEEELKQMIGLEKCL